MALRFQRLTRPAIRALPAGDKINEHGICAERQQSGDIRYSVNIMVDGTRIHRVIGRESEGVTREQAERALENFRTKAREGRLDLPTARKVHRNFAEAGEDYLSRIEADTDKHGRNIHRKRQHIRERLAPYFKTQRPDKLTDFSIAHYARHREKQGASTASINRELATLSHFLGRCLAWGWIKTKPRITKGDEARKQIVILREPEKRALMRAAIGDQDPLTWLFVAIGMGTAMRHGEILRIQWSQIDFDQRRIHVPRAKAGQRIQPMPTGLAEQLRKEWEQLGQPAGHIFPPSNANGKLPHRTAMSQQFRRSVVRAKLDPDKVTPHIMRHTAITELVKAGVDLPTIQKISGHKTLAMVLHYTQLSDTHIDAAVAKLDATFSDTVTPGLHMATDSRQAGVA